MNIRVYLAEKLYRGYIGCKRYITNNKFLNPVYQYVVNTFKRCVSGIRDTHKTLYVSKVYPKIVRWWLEILTIGFMIWLFMGTIREYNPIWFTIGYGTGVMAVLMIITEIRQRIKE